MRENTSNIGDYTLPFLMMVAKNMREHDFSNLDIGYILVSIFHASGQEAELITDSDLEDIQSVSDLNMGREFFESIAKNGSVHSESLRNYISDLMKIYESQD